MPNGHYYRGGFEVLKPDGQLNGDFFVEKFGDFSFGGWVFLGLITGVELLGLRDSYRDFRSLLFEGSNLVRTPLLRTQVDDLSNSVSDCDSINILYNLIPITSTIVYTILYVW